MIDDQELIIGNIILLFKDHNIVFNKENVLNFMSLLNLKIPNEYKINNKLKSFENFIDASNLFIKKQNINSEESFYIIDSDLIHEILTENIKNGIPKQLHHAFDETLIEYKTITNKNKAKIKRINQ